MSIQAPESSVKYTDSQTEQIEEFKTQTLNLQTDITIHSKTLRNLQDSIVNTTKENNFLEQKKIILTDDIFGLETKYESLKLQVEESTKQVENAREEADKLKTLHIAKQTDLDAQEADLVDKQAELKADRLKLDEQIKLNEEYKEELEKKKIILSETISKL